jgi:deoxyribonuclease-4
VPAFVARSSVVTAGDLTRRPRLGVHVSVAGGLAVAVRRAVALGCEAFQIFARNPNQWRSPPLDPVEIRRFREGVAAARIGPVVSHGSYLINLAAAADPLRRTSVDALLDELDRAEALGLEGVVLHPGTAVPGEPVEQALDRLARAIRDVFAARRRQRVRLILEHTAGQGSSLGSTFEQIAGILARLDGSPRLGVCLDTCHLLAAGYDIASPRGYRETFARFASTVGLDRLLVFHVNDSRRPRGSRVDRHAHIGEGYVGLAAFRRLLRDRRFAGLPMLLETEKGAPPRPRSVEPDPFDAMNLGRLRALLAGCAAGARAGRHGRKA